VCVCEREREREREKQSIIKEPAVKLQLDSGTATRRKDKAYTRTTLQSNESASGKSVGEEHTAGHVRVIVLTACYALVMWLLSCL
jgi:hypothetical protein